MEGADQVLAGRQVDRGLAADRGIDHRQQGGRQLHEANAAHPAGRGETGKIANDAAAEREHGNVAAGAEFGQRFQGLGETIQGFFLLARGDDELANGLA